MRANHQIGIKRYYEGAQDAHGNPVEGWHEAIEWVDAYGIAPTSSVEPSQSGREAVIDTLTVYLPFYNDISSKDRIVLVEDEYTIEGSVLNWNTGPFRFQPGFALTLKKVTG
ncbi:head-tail adaptor protein [Streptomyces sp. NPDC059513]|uniref:head-tail adaptor protein n=1 Tax=unclassified Streptomyces TaxID=2593676 RepID=UPI00369D6012